MCPPVLCCDVCGGEGREHNLSGGTKKSGVLTNTKQASPSPGSVIHGAVDESIKRFFSCEKFKLNSKKLVTA